MASKEEEVEAVEDADDLDPEELDDLDPEDDEEVALPVAEEEDDSDEASLDEILSQRAAAKPDEDTDEDDIMSLVSENAEATPVEPLPTRVVPIKDRKEFVCKSCHLVKARSQLADERRRLCRDCV
ncbi:MAG: DUF4193 family protein [Actinomycetota bacterium]